MILFIAWLSFLLSFVDRLTWANVAVSVGGSLGLPVAALGIFVTAFYAGYVVCNALGGILSDRHRRPPDADPVDAGARAFHHGVQLHRQRRRSAWRCKG